MLTAILKKYWKQLAAVGAGLLALLTAYFKGREGGAAKGQKVASEAKHESAGLKADLKAKEKYDEQEAKIRHDADVKRAALDSLGLRDTWPDSGIIELHKANGEAANQLTTAELQLDRD